MTNKAKIAIATGDAAGIGPEISLKAALDPAVRDSCNPIIVSDPALLERHARACGIKVDLRVVGQIADADWSGDRVNVLDCPQPQAVAVAFGSPAPASGRAALVFASAAIKAARAGAVDAVSQRRRTRHRSRSPASNSTGTLPLSRARPAPTRTTSISCSVSTKPGSCIARCI